MSPVFHRENSYSFKIFSNEEMRMHIHVLRDDMEAKYWLEPQVELAENSGMKYVGSYTANEKTFYVVKLGSMTVHIADGSWQIARLSYSEGQNYMQHEFREIKPNLYLLTHGTAKFYIDRAKWPKGYMSMVISYTYK